MDFINKAVLFVIDSVQNTKWDLIKHTNKVNILYNHKIYFYIWHLFGNSDHTTQSKINRYTQTKMHLTVQQ